MTSPNNLTATDAAKAIRAGELTSRALVDACITRAEARDADVGAWTYLNPCIARDQADNCDHAITAGRAPGPLHGIPVGLKDIIDTADMPTENGSRLYEGRRPVADSTIARLLRDARAHIWCLSAVPSAPRILPAGADIGRSSAVYRRQC